MFVGLEDFFVKDSVREDGLLNLEKDARVQYADSSFAFVCIYIKEIILAYELMLSGGGSLVVILTPGL